MLDKLLKSNIAIVGGGNFCKKMLQLLFSKPFEDCRPAILGVADIDSQAEGLLFAKQMGIFATADYRDLYSLKNLQILMEMTTDEELAGIITREKPDGVQLMDHVAARTIWSALQVEAEKRSALKELRRNNFKSAQIDCLFEQFADRLADVIRERSERYVEIESAVRKALLVLKMRGSDHDKGIRQFAITSRGVEVSATFEGREGIMSGSPRRMMDSFVQAFVRR